MTKEEIQNIPVQVEKKLNIYEKLLAISCELQTVAKNLEIQMGNNKYKAVSEADVLRAVKPLEEKYNVYSYPFLREIIESGTLESVDYNGKGKKQLFERIKVVYRFINLEKPDEFVDMISYGDGIDSGDKSVGKAMTYADKYALLKAYKIVTGDDPDQEPSPQELKGVEIKNPKKQDTRANLINEALSVGIDLQKLATYHKKNNPNLLTEEELINAIAMKTGAK